MIILMIMMMMTMTTHLFCTKRKAYEMAHYCGQANDTIKRSGWLLRKQKRIRYSEIKQNGEHSYHFALKEYLRASNVYLILIKSRSQRTFWMFEMKGDSTLGCFSLQRLHEVCLNQKWQALKPANEHWEGLLSNTMQPNSKPSQVIFAKLNSKVQVSQHVFREHSVHSKVTLHITYVFQLYRPPLWFSGQSSLQYNGDVLCFLWGTIWIYTSYVQKSRPPPWSSGQSSCLKNGEVLCFLWGMN
jgi:hypothetical protein